MSAPVCTHCADTGSLSKDLDGHLDCGYCDMAEQRAKFNRWAKTIYQTREAAMWAAYQHGKAQTAVAIN